MLSNENIVRDTVEIIIRVALIFEIFISSVKKIKTQKEK